MKTLRLAVGLSFLLAAELFAQGGLGGPPGRMGGSGTGIRGGSAGRAPRPSGRIPSAVTPSDSSTRRLGSGLSTFPPRPTRSRPVGNVVFPGTPGRSNSGSVASPGLPGSVGQPSILSPGLPERYRPGNVVTPGTPPPETRVERPRGGLFSDTRRRPSGRADSFGRRRGSKLIGNGVIVYPYLYLPFGHDYEQSSYGVVTQGSSSADYVIEGHLDQTQQRSRVYEVGPGGPNEPNAVEGEPAEADESLARPVEGEFYLIALEGGLIYAAREHWLLGNTLHFVTLQGDHYVVSLPEVDLDLSAQLNRERGLNFVLEVREQGGGPPPDPAPGP